MLTSAYRNLPRVCLAMAAGLFLLAGFISNTNALETGEVRQESAEAPPGEVRTMVVGTKDAPPFSMKGKDGEWQGLSIQLWRRIAEDLELKYEFREANLHELLEGVSVGKLDAVVAAVTTTSRRAEKMDFSHPFFSTGLGIAVPKVESFAFASLMEKLTSTVFLKALLTLIVVLWFAGALLWWLERKANPEDFGGTVMQGIGSGFWWSAVTMTTVGYGDKKVKTLGGRLLALLWMFFGVVAISGFTGAIASSLTVTSMQTQISGLEDLAGVRVGVVVETTSESFLDGRTISSSNFDTLADAMHALDQGRLDVVVHDAPILVYMARTQFAGRIVVLPHTYQRQDYGIVLPPDSPIRDELNISLLRHLREGWWAEGLSRYLGMEP